MFHIYFLPCIIFVIESIPKRDVLQIKRVSIIFGAGTQHIVQYIDMPIQVIHPINPHTLFALNPLCAVTIFIKNLHITFYFIF